MNCHSQLELETSPRGPTNRISHWDLNPNVWPWPSIFCKLW